MSDRPPLGPGSAAASHALGFGDLKARAQAARSHPRARQLMVSVLGTALVTFGGIVTGTLLARGLGPVGRGEFAAMLLWPTIAVALGDLGISIAFGYYSASGRDGVPRLMRLSYRVALAQSAYLIPLTLLVSWIALTVAGVMPIGAGLILALVFVPSSLLTRNLCGVFNGQLMFWRFYVLRASALIIAAAALAVLLAGDALTIWTAVFAWTLGLVGMVLVGVVLARRAARERPVPRLGSAERGVKPRGLLNYGVKALAGSIYPLDLLSLDQIFVVFLLGKRDLGLYVSALAFTNLPRLVSYAIGTVGMPVVAANPRDRHGATTVRYVLLAAALLLPLALGLVALAPWLVPLFFGHAFNGAIDPARFLLLGSFAFGVRKVLGDCLRGAGRPGVVSVVEAGSWPLVVAAVALGTLGGLTTVAIGLLVVQVVALAVLLAAQRGSRRPPDGAPVALGETT